MDSSVYQDFHHAYRFSDIFQHSTQTVPYGSSMQSNKKRSTNSPKRCRTRKWNRQSTNSPEDQLCSSLTRRSLSLSWPATESAFFPRISPASCIDLIYFYTANSTTQTRTIWFQQDNAFPDNVYIGHLRRIAWSITKQTEISWKPLPGIAICETRENATFLNLRSNYKLPQYGLYLSNYSANLLTFVFFTRKYHGLKVRDGKNIKSENLYSANTFHHSTKNFLPKV